MNGPGSAEKWLRSSSSAQAPRQREDGGGGRRISYAGICYVATGNAALLSDASHTRAAMCSETLARFTLHQCNRRPLGAASLRFLAPAVELRLAPLRHAALVGLDEEVDEQELKRDGGEIR